MAGGTLFGDFTVDTDLDTYIDNRVSSKVSSIQIANPTTGGTTTITQTFKSILNVCFETTTSIATHTIALPSTPSDNQILSLGFLDAIVSLSFTNGSFATGLSTLINSVAASGSIRLIFSVGLWHKI